MAKRILASNEQVVATATGPVSSRATREGLNVSKSDLQTALEQAVQLAGYTKIAVYGLDGQLWAVSPDDFSVQPEEFQAIVSAVNDVTLLWNDNYLYFEGVPYELSEGENLLTYTVPQFVVRGLDESDSDGIGCALVEQGLIIALFNADTSDDDYTYIEILADLVGTRRN
ncbi:profilin [Nonomuraea sp. NPDC003709]|uniref:profilin n=1 Tax=Nonomuraea sp. NPDC003709 TaxID=3154450 RepID=UPI0033A82194